MREASKRLTLLALVATLEAWPASKQIRPPREPIVHGWTWACEGPWRQWILRCEAGGVITEYDWAAAREKYEQAEAEEQQAINDPGAHYRYGMKVKVTEADLARGYVVANVDPYRIGKLYDLGGGAREHLVKKGLRGTTKGHTERELIGELRCCLDRWEQMLEEDEVA